MRNTQIYQHVAAVARFGSIRAAAAFQAISPSAMNRQILALEEEVGAPLFERLSSGVRLTAAGEIYLNCFRAHLSELERAASQVADLAGERAGRVRIGVGEELAGRFAPLAVGAYRARFPGVQFALRTIGYDEAGPLLGAFDIDLALIANPQTTDAVETLFAAEMEIVAVTRAERARPMRLSELRDLSLILPTARSGLRNEIDAAFAARRADFAPSVEMDRLAETTLLADPNSAQLMLELEVDEADLAARGLGIARLVPGAFRAPSARVLRAKGRTLPVATARFSNDLIRALSEGERAAA